MMNNLAFISVAALLVCSVFAEDVSHHEANGIKVGDGSTKYTECGSCGGADDGSSGGSDGGAGNGSSGGAGGGTGGGPGGYSAGFNRSGVYGGGRLCRWGCCSESYRYSHQGGGYYGCTCCTTPFQAQAYRLTQRRAVEPNN